MPEDPHFVKQCTGPHVVLLIKCNVKHTGTDHTLIWVFCIEQSSASEGQIKRQAHNQNIHGEYDHHLLSPAKSHLPQRR